MSVMISLRKRELPLGTSEQLIKMVWKREIPSSAIPVEPAFVIKNAPKNGALPWAK